MKQLIPFSSQQPAYAGNMSARAAMLTSDRYSMGLFRACIWAIVAYLILVGVTALVVFVMQFFGFKIPVLNPFEVKPRDIEFVLVDEPPAPPRDKNTKNRSDRMSRSGGQKTAQKATAVPKKAAGPPSPKPQPARPSVQPRPTARPASQPRVTPRPSPRPTPAPTPAPAPQPKAAPAPPTPKTPSQSNAPRPALPPSPTAPAIKVPMPGNPQSIATGPVASSSSSSRSSNSSAGGGQGVVGPQAIPGNLSRNLGGGSPGAAGSAGRPGGGAGGAGSYTQAGSPGGGGGRPGIDAMPEPDFGPYIAELQRRIKRNWAPPASDRSKRVVALFTVGRQGQLLGLRIKSSSGSPVADDAALAAVRASAPFRNLPANYRGNSIDVEFIFDYDVYQGARIR